MTAKEVLKTSFYETRYLVLMSGSWFFLCLVLAVCFGAKLSEFKNIAGSLQTEITFIMVMFFIMAIGVYSHHFLNALREKCGGIKVCWKESIRRTGLTFFRYVDSMRMIEAVPLLIFVTFMLKTVGLAKALIVHIHPYSFWDPIFMHIDCALHFGTCPQYLIAPLIEKFSLQSTIDYLYRAWMVIVLATYWYAVFIDPDKVRRKVFLLSAILGWMLIGWVSASVFSSVGPIFFGDFYPDLVNPYAEYVAYLKKIYEHNEMSVIEISRLLLEVSRDPSVIDINGISAMPSMHVAAVTVIARYYWQINKLVGATMLLFTFVILIGSVYLAWHYAIDGYVSAILALIIWEVCNRSLKRRSA